MRQIIRAVQLFITKRRFILLLGSIFLFVPAVACAQVIQPPNEQSETLLEPFWPEQNEITPSIKSNPFVGQNQGPPYGTVVMTQKPVSCNDTPVVKNYIQNAGGMTPLTLGTILNEMGAITSLIHVYANPINKRFAIIEHFATQRSCILTHGNDFEIILPQQEAP